MGIFLSMSLFYFLKRNVSVFSCSPCFYKAFYVAEVGLDLEIPLPPIHPAIISLKQLGYILFINWYSRIDTYQII